jgi:hypothetical protein
LHGGFSKQSRESGIDSVKGHLRNGVGVDLTSVMADREAGANWNARGRGEIVGQLEDAFDFSEGKE